MQLQQKQAGVGTQVVEADEFDITALTKQEIEAANYYQKISDDKEVQKFTD